MCSVQLTLYVHVTAQFASSLCVVLTSVMQRIVYTGV